MNDDQFEHVGMFIKVKTFLNKKATALAATPAIAPLLTALNSKIDAILEEEEDASAPISGNTELKDQLREAVKKQGFEIAAACVAYYTITLPNPVLRSKCEFQMYQLNQTRDSDLYVKIKRVHEIADNVKTLLDPFGVSAGDVDALETSLADYFDQLQGPKDAIGERAASGKQVDRLIQDTIDLINEKIDVVMKFYVTNNPELYDYYTNARKIDQTGGGPIPDEDYELTLTSGQFVGTTVPAETSANSRMVLINGASNGSEIRVGFSNDQNSFTGTFQTVLPGTTADFKANDLGYSTGIGYIVANNPGTPNPVSITIRVKAYY